MKQLKISFVFSILGTVAFCSAVVMPAYAGGPLANCFSGQPFLWPVGGANIPFNPDQGGLGPLTNAQGVAQVEAAFQVWEDVSTATASFTNAGLLPVDVDITNFAPFLFAVVPDGLNAIVFDDTGAIFDLLFGPGSGVLGFAGLEFVNFATCEVVEGLSFLNGPTFTDLTVALDVLVHEFGHYNNIAHTVVNGQIFLFPGDTSGPTPFNTFGTPSPFTDIIETMYPFYFGPAVGTRTLHRDDVAILSTLYPAPSFFGSTGTINGTILAPNGTTKLTGVNVIARNVANPFDDAASAISSDFTEGFSQADPFTGVYNINGLTPGAEYAVFVDQILAGGFSTPPLGGFPGPEEFYNGADESNDSDTDDPSVFEAVTAAAGAPVSDIDIIFNAFRPGEPLPVGDDGAVQVFMPFNFRFCGRMYDSVFVNANGSLTFGNADPDFSESPAEMLSGPPRIAGLWDDLNTDTGGLVTFDESPNEFSVLFDNVPEWFATPSNTFEITLRRGGSKATIEYGDLISADGLAGYSCGGQLTSGFETESDLSSFPGKINGRRKMAIYEAFPDFDNDLANTTLKFNLPKNAPKDKFEPNNSLRKAKKTELPFNTLEKFSQISPLGDDVDYYRFKASAGDTLVAEVIGGTLDSLMGLFDRATGTLLTLDDDGGAGLLSRIVFPIPADGEYALAVTTFPDFDFDGDGGDSGRYVLAVEAIP